MSDFIQEVCVVTHPLSSAGENATRTLLVILSELTSVSLITADLPDTSQIRNRFDFVELTKHPMGPGVIVPGLLFLMTQILICREVWNRDEDVIWFFGATAYLLPISFAKLLGRTVVLQPRGDVPLTLRIQWEQEMPRVVAMTLAGIVSVLERLSFQAADMIVTYTPGMAEQLGLDPTDQQVFTDAARYIDTDRFSPEVPFDDRGQVIGYIGRFDEEKGIRNLAVTVEELPPSITFRFVGDGKLLTWLRRRLADEVTAGRVEFTGWIDHEEVPKEFNKLRLLVTLSKPTEGLPTAILESLACGTPAIAPSVSGVPDVIYDGETGFLLRSEDPKALADEIRCILESKDLAEISLQSRNLATSRYSFEAAVDRYRHILCRL